MVINQKKKTALILGASGQDGALLASDLIKQGWRVVGGTRRGNTNKYWRLKELDIFQKIDWININLQEPYLVLDLIKSVKPDHLYHFAGESFVEDSFQLPANTMQTNYLGCLNVLEAVRISSPETRLFFTSSSEIFGEDVSGEGLDEDSICNPLNPYGISKLASQQLINIYRKRYGLFASCGIMFNHDGPYRARNFVTRKITYNLVRLAEENGEPMQLGNLAAERDWGMASDYVKVMPEILSLKEPQDFVFATGKLTSVKSFLVQAAEAVGFSPIFQGEGLETVCIDDKTGMRLAEISKQYFRPQETPPLRGNASKLRKHTNFKLSYQLSDIAQKMVEADTNRRMNGNIDV
ncbi:GDP-mannose 4,6-dehydratase [Kiloniella sp.]|uniref:GDP-mannose 4,6-dehydratase n=1 Tax=Kiloniella sp. TaxID=1938587 RepID=UPI003A91E3FD